jgi:hypothetical protein
LPRDIPKAPWAVYKDNDWQGISDFLGTNTIAPRLRQYRSYEEASKFATNLNLGTKEKWCSYAKGEFSELPPLPKDIPAAPDKTYKRDVNGKKWKRWGHFLGSGNVSTRVKAKNWLPYEEALIFVMPLNLKTAKDWRKYIKGKLPNLPPLPSDIPRKPDEAYKEFTDWATFLSNDKVSKFNSKRDFWTFEKARQFVHLLGLKNQNEWTNYCAGKLTHLPPKPLEIPSNPNKKYKNEGWNGLKDWLGYKI